LGRFGCCGWCCEAIAAGEPYGQQLLADWLANQPGRKPEVEAAYRDAIIAGREPNTDAVYRDAITGGDRIAYFRFTLWLRRQPSREPDVEALLREANAAANPRPACRTGSSLPARPPRRRGSGL
jgi:hypothetical protein